MAHCDLAKIWKHLESRFDMSSIIREILGQYHLSTTNKPTNVVREFSFRLIVWLKVVFDLQRTYSQDSWSSDPKPHPRLLFAALYQVVDIASQFLGCKGNQTDYFYRRFFVLQALLSGLRALVLRKQKFRLNEISNIRSQVFRWREIVPNDSLEMFTVNKCLDAIGHLTLSSEEAGLSKVDMPACDVVRLPASSGGLYPLFDTSSVHFRKGLDQVRSRDTDPHAFWVLYDILWATELICIRFCAGSVWSDSPGDSDLGEVKKVLKSIGDDTCMEIDFLEASLLSWRDGEECDCLQRLRENNHQMHKNLQHKSEATRYSLQYFLMFLENRQRELLDCELEIRGLSRIFDGSLYSWFHKASWFEKKDLQEEAATTYVLNCPRLHAIPLYILKGLVREGDMGYQDLHDRKPFLNINIRCPSCGDRNGVKSARKIEPLDDLSNAFKQREQKSQPLPVNSLLWEADSGMAISKSNLTRMGTSTGSLPLKTSTDSQRPSISSNSTGRGERRRDKIRSSITGFGRKNPKKDARRMPDHKQSYCFSADGNFILRWTPRHDTVFCSSNPLDSFDGADSKTALKWSKYTVKSVTHVAGGRSRIAAVSEQERKVVVFAMDDGTEFLDQDIDAGGAIWSISMSRNGDAVAVACGWTVLIYDLRNVTNTTIATIPKYTLPLHPESNLMSQKMSFTTDGNEVVVATQHTDERTVNVNISVISRNCEEKWSHDDKMSTPTENDLGLTSVFYDNGARSAVMTAYSNKEYHIMHFPSQKPANPNGGKVQPKIQAAAQAPSGSTVALVDADGQLYRLDVGQLAVKLVKSDFRKRTIKEEADLMAVAMPDEETLRVFWISGGDMIFMNVPMKTEMGN